MDVCEEKQLKELMKIFGQLTSQNQSQLLAIAKRVLNAEKAEKDNVDSSHTQE